MNIEKIFDDFLLEAKKGLVEIKQKDDEIFSFNIKFNHGPVSDFDNNYPNLNLTNKEKLIEKLNIYLKEVTSLYGYNQMLDIENNIKMQLVRLFANATYTDFSNPISFLEKRINFIKDNTFKYFNHKLILDNVSSLNNSSIFASSLKHDLVYETPYVFSVTIENEGVYHLPLISYGISDNTCYIYAIQNTNNEINKYSKIIKRCLYKINGDVHDDYELDNIKDVSPSAIMALTIFLDCLEKNGISDIKVISYLPVRHYAKEVSNEKKANYLKKYKNLELAEFEKIKNELDFEQLRIDKNITDKFIRDFRRLDYHFDNLEITSYPMDMDEYMHLKISPFTSSNNEVLNEIVSGLNNYKKM